MSLCVFISQSIDPVLHPTIRFNVEHVLEQVLKPPSIPTSGLVKSYQTLLPLVGGAAGDETTLPPSLAGPHPPALSLRFCVD